MSVREMLLLMPLFVIFSSVSSFAGTVDFPIDEGEFDVIDIRCKQAVECREVTEEELIEAYILKVDAEATYPDYDGVDQKAPTNGYYVGSVDKFFKQSSIGVSPNDSYYICEDGNTTIDENPELDLDDLIPSDELDLIIDQIGFCHSL